MDEQHNASDDLQFQLKDGIGTITFNRPQARNALTFAMYERLAQICGEADRDRSIKVLILQGAGDKAFAAGTDIAQFRNFNGGEDGLAYERKMDGVLDAIERAAVPTIAVVAGFCTGGGAAIASACDFRLASAGARFGFPIARTLGNCLSMANYARFASLIGPQRVRELILLARMIEATEALAVGLVSEVHDSVTSLHSRAQELGMTLAGHAPITMHTTREALRRLQAKIADENIDDLIRQTYASADFREGMNAFLEKRPPKWTGR